MDLLVRYILPGLLGSLVLAGVLCWGLYVCFFRD
jgi:hypothetical protein